ncbi:CpaF family protein [Zavarzinia sp. CC-PAN008]|uniref:CpaF family protein n=1 Tax=Zavarzinia sp. CC-PAN008 TaxID=3243332 RepID=UPI003F749E18
MAGFGKRKAPMDELPGAASAAQSRRLLEGPDGRSDHLPVRQRGEGALAEPDMGGNMPPPSGGYGQGGNAAAGPQAAPSRSPTMVAFKERVRAILMPRIDPAAAARLPRPQLEREIEKLVHEITTESRIQLNEREQRQVAHEIVDDMVGLGPLEPLLDDGSVNDILVNGYNKVFVERAGKLVQTDVVFRDDAHVLNICQRIATRIGRRIDESSPMVDARLADGSRVNIVVPPLALDGPCLSIRKFAKKSITLDIMVQQNNLSANLAKVLQIASAARLNVIVSGGTGSGKTTMMNAMSRLIDPQERIVTVEDAAELQLQQPHVVRLESRPPNIEGQGEVTIRDLVRNALRMRPDRIIVGEVRGAEALDMLQAMNTGHDGSMATIHANRPRDALTRIENMVAMAGVNLPTTAVRQQIVGAVNLIIQVERMRDGIRRITNVTEVIGMEGNVITTQDLFNFEFQGENRDGTLIGAFKTSGVRPAFASRAAYYGLDRALLLAMT